MSTNKENVKIYKGLLMPLVKQSCHSRHQSCQKSSVAETEELFISNTCKIIAHFSMVLFHYVTFLKKSLFNREA